jgi:hypothetical protein
LTRDLRSHQTGLTPLADVMVAALNRNGRGISVRFAARGVRGPMSMVTPHLLT